MIDRFSEPTEPAGRTAGARGWSGIPVLPPFSAAYLDSRNELVLTYYSTIRPHQGLGGATPAEVNFKGQPPGRLPFHRHEKRAVNKCG